MSAYVIGDIKVTDQATFERFRRQVTSVVEKFGGRFVARGGRLETLEGDWRPARLVIMEFPSFEQAKRWYHSEEFRTVKELRKKSAHTSVVLVQGERVAKAKNVRRADQTAELEARRRPTGSSRGSL